MSTRKKIRPSVKELLQDLKGMTFLQKVDHLWTYYKEYLLVVFLVLVVISVVATSIANTRKEVLLSGMMVNIKISQQGYNYLSTDYFEEIGGKEGSQVVQLSYTNFESLADPTSGEDNYAAAQALIARVSGGLLDYMILDDLALEFYITQEVFLDLRELFTTEELEQLAQQDLLVYGQEGDRDSEGNLIPGTGERIPYAVKMSQLSFTQDTMGGDEVYFTVSGNHPDLEGVRNMWAYLQAWE